VQAYLFQRILLAFPVLIGVAAVTFLLIRIVPGTAVDVQLGASRDPADREKLERQLGLDKSIPEQFLIWVKGVVTGDLGESFMKRQAVGDVLKQRFPVTLEMAMIATAVALVLAIPFGVVSAIRQDSPLDHAVRLVSILGLAIPGFWLATLIITLPAIWWHTTVPLTFTPFLRDPIGNLHQMIFPALTLGVAQSAILMRLTRSSMLEVLRQDYVRTAWSKGLRERVVVFRHALKNALIPVVTVWGLQFSALLGGTVIQERIFNFPGLGQAVIESITARDYPVIQAVVLLFALVYVLMNLLVDLTYSVLDPRIRYG
jgi:peptide/nickel transport system permease protein